jgi:quercetin dioxygenase-like cupin family protein
VKRFVTGHDADGQSTFILNETEPVTHVVGSGATRVTELWETHSTPADNNGTDDAAERPFRLPPPAGGSIFRIVEYPPDTTRVEILRTQQPHDDAGEGFAREYTNAKHPGFHKTATIDYAIVLNGEIYAVLDTGEALLRAGDVLVQRGTNHAWSNRTSEPVSIAFVLIAATAV